MELTYNTTYKVFAYPNQGYVCDKIAVTGLEVQPATTVDPNTGVGTAKFTMNADITAVDATFKRKSEPTSGEVQIGNGTEDPAGTAPSRDGLGQVEVVEDKE